MDTNISASIETLKAFLKKSYNTVVSAGGVVPPVEQQSMSRLPEAIASISDKVVIYEGTSSPSNSLGKTGDLYFKHK